MAPLAKLMMGILAHLFEATLLFYATIFLMKTVAPEEQVFIVITGFLVWMFSFWQVEALMPD